MKTIFIVIVLFILGSLIGWGSAQLVRPAHGGDVCLTKKQARQLWPRQHLYWYGSDHCWSNRRGKPPSGIKIDPIKTDKVDGNIATFRGKLPVMAQAESAADPVAPPPPAEAFKGEPMRMFMVPEYAKKEVDLAAPPDQNPVSRDADKAGRGNDPPTGESRPPQNQSTKMRLDLWFVVVSFGAAISILSAFVIISLQQRRKRYVPTTANIERSNHATPRPGKHESTRGDGAGNQQSHFSARDIHGRKRGIEQRRHDADPSPVANRRNDISAIGAWSSRFGLCTEASAPTGDAAECIGDQSNGDRWYRKRFARFAAWR